MIEVRHSGTDADGHVRWIQVTAKGLEGSFTQCDRDTELGEEIFVTFYEGLPNYS